MAFRLITNVTGGAPAMNGTTGQLITVMDFCLVTNCGWTKAFSGSSKAAYQQAGGNLFYVRVQDDGPGAGTFKEARIRGYEAMTDVDTGTNPFPSVAQQTNGMFVRKSTTTDSTARDYVFVGDDRTFYLFVKSEVAVGVAGVYYGWGFGDIYSLLSSDGYRTFIQGRTTENSTTLNAGSLGDANTQSGIYIARNRNGLAGSPLNPIKYTPASGYDGNASASGDSTIPLNYPNGEDGGLFTEPIYFVDNTTAPTRSVRGFYRGIWFCSQNVGATVSNADTVSGVGDFAGKTFRLIKQIDANGTNCVLAVETSSSWPTNS